MATTTVPDCKWHVGGFCWRRARELLGEAHKLAAYETSPPPEKELRAALMPIPVAERKTRCGRAAGRRCQFAGWPRYQSYKLRVGRNIVLCLTSRATNQHPILVALEEHGWPPSIADPLGNDDQPGFEKRLRDTVHQLSSHQYRIFFSSESDPRRVRWRFLDAEDARRKSRKKPRMP